jgi:hypothetical protein
MADFQQIENSVNYKFKDLGDGTWARVMALDAGGVNISSVSVSNIEVSNDVGNPIPVVTVQRVCLGIQTLSVTTSAVSTLTVPSNAVAAIIQADGNPVSITLDGTAPTATVGIRLDDGVQFYVDTTLSSVKLIARTGTANVQVLYYNKV